MDRMLQRNDNSNNGHNLPSESTGMQSNHNINHSGRSITGPLIPPSNSLVRQYIMGSTTPASRRGSEGRPVQSNLTALLQRHDEEEKRQRQALQQTTDLLNRESGAGACNEADSASGPSLNHNLPSNPRPAGATESPFTLHPASSACSLATSTDPPLDIQPQEAPSATVAKPRRCISSKELGTLAPPSGSPYAYMLYKKEMLEVAMRKRLQERRELAPRSQSSSPPLTTAHFQQFANMQLNSDLESSSDSRCSSAPTIPAPATSGMANERRNRRRAEHNQAVISDLCEIVADLFIAEAKLLNPSNYGVEEDEKFNSFHHSPSDNHLLTQRRQRVLQTVRAFVSSLPTRYALGVETPSEVLVHMRLMAAVRSDETKAVVHIVNLDDAQKHFRYVHTSAESTRSNSSTGLVTSSNPEWRPQSSTPIAKLPSQMNGRRSVRLVTIVCGDADGLLEYITKLLGTGGSRVLDADVMLSKDNIVLDRFVVEMNGRLRLDKLANYIEAFLKDYREKKLRENGLQSQQSTDENKSLSPEVIECKSGSLGKSLTSELSPDNKSSSSSTEPSGPLYVSSTLISDKLTPSERMQEEMETAVPLATVLARGDPIGLSLRGPSLLNHPLIRRQQSMPIYPWSGGTSVAIPNQTKISKPMDSNCSIMVEEQVTQSLQLSDHSSMRQKRPLVNRHGAADLDRIGDSDDEPSFDFFTVPTSGDYSSTDGRVIPLIPFEDLMLIENLGTGRVSTIYRAAWKRSFPLSTNFECKSMWSQTSTANNELVQMVALKVAMVNPETRDASNVDELRREGDIAARLQHPNICDIVGVAADSECFCLAFDYCERGSLLSLLSDATKPYEYLPIALDVANGMAYLHSRNVIHRDLKPSNILLTKDNRAKIADFGMSVNFSGQELTAETGTYRYMAPEVIRHESYSSNADVYSFGICLWQLITREVPFATMTPIQAAYAVAEGRRPEIPESTPRRLQDIIMACWDQDSHKRPSFTYIALALADYAKMAFSPANVGAQTLHIANEMLASVEGNSTVNVDFSTLMSESTEPPLFGGWLFSNSMKNSASWQHTDSASSDGANVGLEI